MKRGRTMLYNTILLTATAFLMRTVGMAFQVYLSRQIGAAGIGLFQLIMSVSMLATTFALSGIRFATTRLVSEELGKNNPGGVKPAVRRCLIYSASFGTAAMAAMWFGSDYIGGTIIGDYRTVLSLRLLALSLPAFSLSAVLAGYFTAVSRVIKSASVQIVEQVIRISFVVAALSIGYSYDLRTACAIIVMGGTLGEICSFIFLYLLYKFDVRKFPKFGRDTGGMTNRMLRISLPLALSAYARTALSTVQNLLVPRGLRRSGASAEQALADYGIVQGMVFPVIMFPSALFYSLAELLVPELTEAQVRNQRDVISALTSRTLRLCLLFSIGVTAILFRFSGELGYSIYNNTDVGRYIRILSLLMPIMYLDTVIDGMLRGLGQQIYSMKVNIIDSLISVLLVYFLLPTFAVMGYLFMIGFTEVFNFALSLHRLSRITEIRFSVVSIVKSVFCAAGAISVAVFSLRSLGLPLDSSAVSVTLHIVLSVAAYAAFLAVTDSIDSQDISWIKSIFGFQGKFAKTSSKIRKKNV
ncbi:MAG: oligosaccharide flippase family protein [Oscillospiraceae bacterium]|nr:oligosaccharide flippase family protein [Oscillospiraceae bacterium]